MKVTCNIVRDILPLYYENMASSNSITLIEEHIDECDACRTYLDEMKSANELPVDTDTAPLLKIKSTLRKKKIQTVLLSVMVSLVIGALVIAYLTSPEYIPYSEASVSINELDDGSVVATFNDKVSGYDINHHPTHDNRGGEYHLTTWDSIWNRMFSKSNVNNTILNPNGERVLSVYYYETDGSEDKLLYGREIVNGGVVTLPRLVLSYYFQVALAVAIFCGLLMILLRRKKKIMNIFMKIMFLPISYMIASLMITGFSTVTYSATRDFYGILLIAIPLYIAFLTAINLIKQRKNKGFVKG